ncbi:autophagy-related protein 101 [Pelomyxa schiedti]|nr:autophagy-related protein 101 [Pelomyxa schiedti]
MAAVTESRGNVPFAVLEVPLPLLNDIFACILHTLLFHRELGVAVPEERCVDPLDTYYSKCKDAGIDQKVNTEVNKFVTWVKSTRLETYKVSVKFFDKPRTGLFGFTKPGPQFEDWKFGFKVTDLAAQSRPIRKEQIERISNQLKIIICRILEQVTHTEHLPKIPSAISKNYVSEFTYPFEVSFPGTW